MLSVSEAEKIILDNVLELGAETIPLPSAVHRVLAVSLCADRDFPPFDRVTMDGIAVRFQRFEAGQRTFVIRGVAAAGMPCQTLEDAAGCIEVMTGTMLPAGTDTVIRYEDVHIQEGIATIAEISINSRQNVHFQGIDRKMDDIIVPAGRQIGSAEIGVAATVGAAEIAVSKLPRVAIISTGDELLPIAATPQPWQIRGSNVCSIQSLLWEQYKIEGEIFHFPDDEQRIEAGLKKILHQYEIVILSGAVSEGKFDYVPKILSALGVEKLFHKVSQRPGKPFWFGKFREKSVVFALPGNPVSTFMCACRYVLPFLRKSMGLPTAQPCYAILSTPMVFAPALTYYVPAKITYDPNGRLIAHPLPGHGSGDLANLVDADGFLELPLERSTFEAGEVFPFIAFRR